MNQDVWIHLKLSSGADFPFNSLSLVRVSSFAPSRIVFLCESARGSMQTILKFETLSFWQPLQIKFAFLSGWVCAASPPLSQLLFWILPVREQKGTASLNISSIKSSLALRL